MSARGQMLDAIRRSLKRGPLAGPARDAAEARLAAPVRGPVPKRADVDHAGQVALFCQWAETNNASVARAGADEVPAEIAGWLKRNNLPARAAMAPSAELDRYDWASQKLLELRRGIAVPDDQVAITGAFAAIAETGTLVMASGPGHPVTLNLLPETHVVVLREQDIVGGYETVWERLRAAYGRGAMPRTVNTITGPSRTGDIEQTIELGAHGPRRMHIVVVRP